MNDCKELDVLVIVTTLGSAEDATRLARDLVERGFVACAEVDAPMRSFYRWEGRVCDEMEVRLVLKTTPEREASVKAFIGEHHPYELPQWLSVRMRGSEAYTAWVRETAGVR